MNLLEFEMAKADDSVDDTNNKADLIMMIQQLIGDFETGQGGKKEENFWKKVHKLVWSYRF